MRRFIVSVVAAVTAVGLGCGTSALAAPAANVSFFTGADGTAHWGPQKSAIVLSETTTPGAYAGASLMHVGAVAPTDAPIFTQQDTVNEAGGGSPRLVIAFADGGNIDGYRLLMSTDPQSTPLQWDSNGGSAGFLYGKDYATALADHGGSPVVAVYLVTDSGWEGLAYTNTITNVMYGDNAYA